METPRILLVIPAYNEAGWIAEHLARVSAWLAAHAAAFDVTILCVDNNSSDETAAQIQSVPGIRFRREPVQGKGQAVVGAWEAHAGAYDVYAFIDADLATELDVLPELFGAAAAGTVAICTRHTGAAQVDRPLGRLIVSKCSSLMTRLLLSTAVSDTMCGCKAFPAAVIDRFAAGLSERKWFFDTELVLRAERAGVPVREFPVRWHEPRTGRNKSKVNVWRTALRHLALMLRLRSRL